MLDELGERMKAYESENIPIFTQDREYIERRLVDTMAAS